MASLCSITLLALCGLLTDPIPLPSFSSQQPAGNQNKITVLLVVIFNGKFDEREDATCLVAPSQTVPQWEMFKQLCVRVHTTLLSYQKAVCVYCAPLEKEGLSADLSVRVELF